MRNKGLLIVTGGLVVGAAIVLLLDRQEGPEDRHLGKTLLPPAAGVAVDAIEIGKGDKIVHLVRDDRDIWHLDDAEGFPADARRVLRLIDELGQARFSVRAPGKGDNLADFGLSRPTKLAVTTKGTKTVDLALGDRRSAGGIYAAVAGESRVYVVDPAILPALEADDWELKQLVDIKRELIKSVAFFDASGAPAITIERGKADEPMQVAGLASTQKEKPTVRQTENLLAGLNFSRRWDPGNEEAKGALAKPTKTFVTLFDGRSYAVQVGSIGQKWFIKIVADRNGASLDAASEGDLMRLAELMTRYAFEVPAAVAQRFARTADDFVETPAAGKG